MKKVTVSGDFMTQRSDLDVGEPGSHGPEALLHGDVVHDHHAICLAKELLGYAAIPVSHDRFPKSAQ